jgi:NADPH:quinone reductase-like Zn-dependent oxidoreductase
LATPRRASFPRCGADHVIEYHDYDFAEAVEKIAGPKPLDVV